MGADDTHGTGRPGDREDRPPEPAEEFRYEGPITFDDEEFDEEYEQPGGGKTFLTTVIVAAAVVIIVAIALFMRSGRSSDETDLAELAAPEPATEQTLEDAGDAAGMPEEAAATEGGATVDYRAVPDAAQEPPAPTSSAPPSPAVESPQAETAPRESRRARAQKTPPSPREGVSFDELTRLAGSGRVDEAAAMGLLLAPGRDTDWTLQVLFACNPDNVSRAFRAAGGEPLIVYPASAQGRDCYRLCWGDYATRDAAEQASGTVPKYFRDAGRPHPLRNTAAR